MYQIYGKRSAAEVYGILKEIDADFVIVEHAQCYTDKPIGCRTRDIVDIAAGDQLDDSTVEAATSGHGRFCHEVSNKRTHGRFFRLKFENDSFRVYKVIK